MAKGDMGFTLIEILITAMIIAILAVIMMPQYTRFVESSRGKEGIMGLKSIRAAEKIYKADNATYTNAISSLSTHIGNPNSDANRSFDYTITSGGSSFTAQATRRLGVNSGETITMDDTGTVNPGGTDTWSP